MDARPFIDGLPGCDAPLPEIAPARLAGLAALGGAPLRPIRRVALLGCGSGVGLAILAAAWAGPGRRLVGAAEDAEDLALSQALLAQAGLEAEVRLASPEAPEALVAAGPFDLIACPNGWARLSAARREALAEALGEAVAPGGAVMLRRPVAPGAAEARAAAQMLRNRWAALPEDLPPQDRARRTLADARALLEASHSMVRFLSSWEGLMQGLERLPLPQLLRDWIEARGPDWSLRDEAEAMTAAGFGRLAPATPDALAPSLFLSPEAVALARAAPTPLLAAEVADLCDDRLIRSDLHRRDGWAAAAQAPRLVRLPAAEGEADLTPAGLAPYAARLSREAYAPLIAALPDAGGATPAELARAAGLAEADIVERLAALVAAEAAGFAADRAPQETADEAGTRQEACARLNAELSRRGRVAALASTVLGGALRLPAADQDDLRRNGTLDPKKRSILARAGCPTPDPGRSICR